MLAVVCEARTRDASSFGRLTQYMHFGSGQSRKLDPATGEVVERGEMHYSDAIINARTAVAEMEAVAAQNARIVDPIFHYVLAWQEGEEPSSDQWREAVRLTQAAMGMYAHQYVAALHQDGTTWHVHVLANRVHPDTYRAADLWKCHERLDVAIREIEHLQGWKESAGLARWQDGEAVLLTKDEKRTRREGRADTEEANQGAPAQMQSWRDAESFLSWVRGEPSRALDAMMKRPGVTWIRVHETPARFGLTLNRTQRQGLAGYTVSARDERGREVYAKASDAFRKHFAGKRARSETHQKLGAWQAPAAAKAGERSPPEQNKYSAERTPGEGNERAERKAARDRARQKLKAHYQAYRREWWEGEKARRAQEAKELKEAMAAIAVRRRERAKGIRAQRLPRELRQVALSIIAAEAIQARALLRSQFGEARRARGAQDYRSWVEARAAEGDAAAIAQLRGFYYAEQRSGARSRREAEVKDEGISDGTGQRSEPGGPRAFRSGGADAKLLTWVVDRRRGFVEYSLAGRRAFTDEGSLLRMSKELKGTIDRDPLRVALQLAVQKWGRELSLSGNEAFRRAVVEEAVRLGLQVRFKDAEDERYRQQCASKRGGAQAGGARADPLAAYQRAVDEAEQSGDELKKALAVARLTVAEEYQAAGKNPMHQFSEIDAEARRRVFDPKDQRPVVTPAAANVSTSETAERQAKHYAEDFRTLAEGRRLRTPGYADEDQLWSRVPEAVRARVERINAMPAVERDKALEGLQREAVGRFKEDPGAAERESLRDLVGRQGRGR